MILLNDKIQKYFLELSGGKVLINQVQADEIINLCCGKPAGKTLEVKLYEFNAQNSVYALDLTMNIDFEEVMEAMVRHIGKSETKEFYWFQITDNGKPVRNIYTINRNYFRNG